MAWGEPNTYWFCFDGIAKGSVVAVSTLGVRTEKTLFMQGYDEMLRKIKPDTVICYGKPFEEMKGKIIEIDYAETNNFRKNFVMRDFEERETEFQSIINGMQITKICESFIKGMGSAFRIIAKFPGWDPTKPPGKDYEWRGKGEPGSSKGGWYNPKTKETMHPDLDHPEPYGPHWDYIHPDGWKRGYRLFPDGTHETKIFEGDVCFA